MKRLFYTLTAAMIISLIFLLFFFYIGVFSPLRDELGATLIDDFKRRFQLLKSMLKIILAVASREPKASQVEP